MSAMDDKMDTWGELDDSHEMDEIERLIRAARPPSASPGDPLSDRGKREMDRLLVSSGYAPVYFVDGPSTAGRRSRWRFRPAWIAAAAVVAVVIVAASILWPGAAPPAHAATPPLLVIEPLADPDPEMLADLADAARESEFSVPARGEDVTIRMQSWVLNIEDVDGEIDPSLTVVSPEVHTFTFGADGSMSQVVIVGQAYDDTGEPVADQDPPAGEVLWTFEQGPGEYESPFATAAPRDSSEVEEFLTLGGGLAAGESASNAFLDVRYLLGEQRLDGPQTAALLEFLATLTDYMVEGTTADRLGRPALVLTAPRADGEYADSLLLDPQTGQVLGFETTYTGTSRTDLTAPAVTTYLAWENTT